MHSTGHECPPTGPSWSLSFRGCHCLLWNPLGIVWILFPGSPFLTWGSGLRLPMDLDFSCFPRGLPHVAWNMGSGTGIWDRALRLELCEFPLPCFSHTCKMGCSQPRLPRMAVRAVHMRHWSRAWHIGRRCPSPPHPRGVICHPRLALTPFLPFDQHCLLCSYRLFLSPVGHVASSILPIVDHPRHQHWSLLSSALRF